MPDLTLYFKPTCPYCQKVLAFMGKEKWTIEGKNIDASPDLRDELITKGGKKQVPALDVDGQIIYESDAIIDYLKELKG